MKPISAAVDGILAPKQPLEDEYRNEADGLIYCAKCHTPRQHRIQLNDRVLLPTVRCRCQQEAYEKEEAERKQQEFLMQVSRLKTNGLQDKSLRDYTFANDKGYNPEIQKAHDYVAHWEEMKAKSLGLLLWGDVGTGKSFFAGCIANKYSLLIIDDLGIERGTEFSLEQVFNVIDSRYRSKKPMIVTTNLTLDELKHPVDLAHARIYDRILERCVPLKINNQNIRELNAAANMQEARKLFDTGT